MGVTVTFGHCPRFYCATQLNTMNVCGTHSKQQIFNVPNVVLQDEDMQKLPFSPFCAKGQKQSCFWLKIVSLPGKFPGYAHEYNIIDICYSVAICIADNLIVYFIVLGVFSVPSFKTSWFWYNWRSGSPEYVNFMKKDCPPNWTYADFAPEFTAEFYNPDQWTEIIQASGAK